MLSIKIKYSLSQKIKYYILRIIRSTTGLFIPFLFLIIFSSCNNWKSNPVTIKNNDIIVEEVKGDAWYKEDFPPGTVTFFPYTIDLIFAGTNDGKIYVSNDNCRTWIESSMKVTNKGPIKSIRYAAWKNDMLNWNLALACSGRGLYRSKDNGRSWYEITALPSYYAESEANTITFGRSEVNSNGITSSVTQYVVIGGKYGDYNTVWYTFYSSSQQDSISLRANFLGRRTGIIKNLFCIDQLYYCGLTDSNSWYIATGDPTGYNVPTQIENLNNFGAENEINAFAKIILPNSAQTIAAATKTGLYSTYNWGKTWQKWGLDKSEIDFLKINSANILFAGTPKGLFGSTDRGMNWREISPEPGIAIEGMELGTDDYLYIKKSNDEYLFIKTDSKTISRLFPPIINFPKNNSIDIDTNFTIEWLNWMKEEPSFWVQVSRKNNFSSNIILDRRYIKGNKCNLTGLKSKTIYYLRIRSETVVYQTDWSEVINFTTR